MKTDKVPQTLEELERIATERLKQQPGLEMVESATISLDEDGRWTIGLKVQSDRCGRNQPRSQSRRRRNAR